MVAPYSPQPHSPYRGDGKNRRAERENSNEDEDVCVRSQEPSNRVTE